MRSLENVKETETEFSKAATGALCASVAGVGTVGLGVHYLLEEEILGSELGTAAKVGIYAATAPLSLLLSPVATPIVAILFVKSLIDEIDVDDLIPVSDEEDM